MAGWVARAGDRHPRQAGRLRVRPGLSRRSSTGGHDDDVQRRGLAARPPRRRRATAAAPRTASTAWRRTTPRCSARCSAPSAPCGALDVRRGERVALVRRRRAGLPGVVPRRAARPASCRCRCRRCSPRATWRPSSPTPAPASPCCRRPTPATSTRSPRPTPSCATPSSSATPAGGDARPGARLVVVHRRRRGAGRRHGRRLAGVLALQLGHDRRAQGRDAPPRQPAGDGRDVRPRGPRHRPRRPLPVRRQAVLRLRARQLADVPALRRRPARSSTRAGRRRPTSPRWSRPSSRRCSSPAPGSSPACSTPTSPASTFASVRATVTAGEALPADLQRRFAARFGHPVLDGIGTTEALHIFLSNRKGEERPGTSGRPVPGYEARLVDDTGALVTAADTPGYLQVRARRWPPGTGAATPRPAPRSRASGWRPATSTRAPPTATGRSSGATAT